MVRMRIVTADSTQAKGWLCGPWDSDLNISLGYANQGIDEPHVHRQMTEIYCMARGTATMRVEQQTIELVQDQTIVIEPGEAHTFLSSSPDHFHFVIQTPGLYGERAQADKVRVSRSRLGLPDQGA
jgi:mannose-6-phosphate isomerase-like protein (cupin superfamily)